MEGILWHTVKKRENHWFKQVFSYNLMEREHLSFGKSVSFSVALSLSPADIKFSF